MLLKNPALESPNISPSAYVSESAVITGNVIIGERAFLALHSSIRADEPGSQVIIGNGCNIQDNVIIHTLTNTKAVIGDYSSPSHGCIVHGPIEVGKNCFIGFGAVIFDCSIGNSCFVSHRALVRGVNIASRRAVKDGAVVVGQIEADRLEEVTAEHTEFSSSVARTNIMLAESYRLIKRHS
ncbi:MAG: carbonate dehydratase [Candidatus Methanoperedens sp.]|nr:carbonate dehydratase [Candidatus Methanoperedens sp.]